MRHKRIICILAISLLVGMANSTWHADVNSLFAAQHPGHSLSDKNGDGIIDWTDVNDVTNTGEQNQLVAGVSASIVAQHLSGNDILQGYSMGKVSLKMVCSLYTEEPDLFPELKSLAMQYPDFEKFWKADQGTTPPSSAAPADTTETAKEETTSADTSKSSTDESDKETAKEKTTEETSSDLDESVAGDYVVIIDTNVLDSANGEKIDTIAAGTVIAVSGSANGYYKISYDDKEGYVIENADTIIPKADYDAAWEETDRLEPTCTEDGYIVKTNSYSKLEETTTLSATGHDDGEWETVEKPGLFSKGLKQRLCTIDGAVLEEKEINQLITLPVGIGIIATFGAIAGGTVFFVKKRRK